MNFDVFVRLREWKDLPDVSAPARSVLWVLAAWENETSGEMFLGNRALSQATGFKRTRITDARAELVRAGLIDLVAPANTIHLATTYRLGGIFLRDIGGKVTAPDNVRPFHRKARTAPSTSEPPRFSDLWAAYPNGKDRKKAVRAFAKLKPADALIDQIIAHVNQRKLTEEWTEKGGKYVPLLSTFLNNERWNDPIKALEGAAVLGGRTVPDATAWRRECAHVPACRSVFEHEARAENARAV